MTLEELKNAAHCNTEDGSKSNSFLFETIKAQGSHYSSASSGYYPDFPAMSMIFFPYCKEYSSLLIDITIQIMQWDKNGLIQCFPLTALRTVTCQCAGAEDPVPRTRC